MAAPTTTVTLTDEAAEALALSLTAEHLRDHWLQWEHLPLLDEDSFNRVADAVDRLADKVREWSRLYDAVHDLDADELWETVA